MAAHLCPWWGGYFIDNRFRRFLHNPEKILAPYVRQGMTVMDFGCGMGFFSIAMAKMAGVDGRVIAVDVQQQMLDVLRRRAERAGVADRIRTHRCVRDSIGVYDPVDFAIAFWSAHETPDSRRLLLEVHRCLVHGGRFFVAEPRGHVSRAAFEGITAAAREIGFTLEKRPRLRLSRAATFIKLSDEVGPRDGDINQADLPDRFLAD